MEQRIKDSRIISLPTKLSEMNPNKTENFEAHEQWEAGARSALNLPEVQRLVTALEAVGRAYSFNDAKIIAQENLTQWHQFTNSNKGGGE